MKFYKISNSTNEKEVGTFLQCKGIITGKNADWFKAPNSMTNLTNDDFPTLQPDLRFELEEKAIKTDLIKPSNISAKGLLVSKRLLSFLSSFQWTEEHSILFMKAKKNMPIIGYISLKKIFQMSIWRNQVCICLSFLSIKVNMLPLTIIITPYPL